MTNDLGRLPVRRSGVRLRDERTQSLLEVPSSDAVYALNPTARAVWELCDGMTTLDELALAFCQVFSVSRSQAVAEVGAVLAQLAEAGLVDWVENVEATAR